MVPVLRTGLPVRAASTGRVVRVRAATSWAGAAVLQVGSVVFLECCGVWRVLAADDLVVIELCVTAVERGVHRRSNAVTQRGSHVVRVRGTGAVVIMTGAVAIMTFAVLVCLVVQVVCH